MNRDRFKSVAAEWNFNPIIIEMFQNFSEQFRKSIPLNNTMDIIDIGGGTGLTAFDLAEDVKSVTIVDNSPSMVNTARKRLSELGVENVRIVESDILHADLPKECFDIVYGHMSFHHIANLHEVYQKSYALLKPKGKLIIGDLCSEDGSFHGDEPVPHNGFDSDAVAKELVECNFSSIETAPLQKVKRPGRKRPFDRFMLVATK